MVQMKRKKHCSRVCVLEALFSKIAHATLQGMLEYLGGPTYENNQCAIQTSQFCDILGLKHNIRFFTGRDISKRVDFFV